MATARQQRNLLMCVTRWPTSMSSFDGFSFGTPVVQKGRWEDKSILFRNAAGEEVTSKAVVYLTDDIPIGDFIALGDYSDISDPTTIAGAFRVAQFNKVSDLRNVEVQRTAYL